MKTYYQRRNASNSNVFGTDPCPVCMEYHNRVNSNYCSAKCTALAQTWRRKFLNDQYKLIALDFRLEFISGVIPNIHLPGYAIRFYPQGESSFIPVLPGIFDIRSNNAATFNNALEWNIGTHAMQFIHEMKKDSRTDVHEMRKLFEAWLSLGLQSQETNFICDDCNNLYLKSGLTSWHDEKLCSYCSASKIPF